MKQSNGGTNVEGGWVQAEYRLMDALTLSAKHHFVSFIDRPAGQSNSLVHRMQLNAVLAF